MIEMKETASVGVTEYLYNLISKLNSHENTVMMQ